MSHKLGNRFGEWCIYGGLVGVGDGYAENAEMREMVQEPDYKETEQRAKASGLCFFQSICLAAPSPSCSMGDL